MTVGRASAFAGHALRTRSSTGSALATRTTRTTFDVVDRPRAAAQILLVIEEETAAFAAVPTFATHPAGTAIAAATTIGVGFTVGSPAALTAIATRSAASAVAAGTSLTTPAIGLDAAPVLLHLYAHTAAGAAIRPRNSASTVAAPASWATATWLVVIPGAAICIVSVTTRPASCAIRTSRTINTARTNCDDVDCH